MEVENGYLQYEFPFIIMEVENGSLQYEFFFIWG